MHLFCGTHAILYKTASQMWQTINNIIGENGKNLNPKRPPLYPIVQCSWNKWHLYFCIVISHYCCIYIDPPLYILNQKYTNALISPIPFLSSPFFHSTMTTEIIRITMDSFDNCHYFFFSFLCSIPFTGFFPFIYTHEENMTGYVGRTQFRSNLQCALPAKCIRET